MLKKANEPANLKKYKFNPLKYTFMTKNPRRVLPLHGERKKMEDFK